jgi:hypothetical protein
MLVEGGNDLRKLPLHLRKTSLQRLFARRPEGIFVNPVERGEISPDLFRAACRMGWRAWSRSIGIGHIRPADRNIGSSKEPNACGNVSRDECAWFEVRPVEPLRRSERWRVRHRAGSRARSSGCEYDPSGPRKKVRTAVGRQICTVHPTWPSFKGGP